MDLTRKDQEALMDAHLMNKLEKNPNLIKAKLVDKQGRVTEKGIKECHRIAGVKHAKAWA